MNYNPSYFNLKKNKLIPVDEFVEKVLYEPNKGYYTKKIPFGSQGDFVTAPTILNLFSHNFLNWALILMLKLPVQMVISGFSNGACIIKTRSV